MGAQHTPGPWRGCKAGDCSCGMVWSIPADHPICTVESGPWGDTWPSLRAIDAGGMAGTAVEAYLARSDYGEVDTNVAKANARLIAAAPELLAALRELLGSCTRTPVGLGDGGTYMVTAPTMDAIKRASAAIAKATATHSTGEA